MASHELFQSSAKSTYTTSWALPQRTSWRPSSCHLVGGPAWLPRTDDAEVSVGLVVDAVSRPPHHDHHIIITAAASNELSLSCMLPLRPPPLSNEAALLILLRIQSLLAVQLVRRGGGREHTPFASVVRRPSRRSHSDTSRLPFPALACHTAAQVVIGRSSVPPTEGETHSNDSIRALPPTHASKTLVSNPPPRLRVAPAATSSAELRQSRVGSTQGCV